MTVQIRGTKSEVVSITIDEVSFLESVIELVEKRHPRLHDIVKIDEAGFIHIVEYDDHNYDPVIRQTKELATEQDKYYFELREQLRLMKLDYRYPEKLANLIDTTPCKRI